MVASWAFSRAALSAATLAVGLVFEWVAPTDALRAVDLAARSDADWVDSMEPMKAVTMVDCWAGARVASMDAMWVAQRDKSMVGLKARAMVVP